MAHVVRWQQLRLWQRVLQQYQVVDTVRTASTYCSHDAQSLGTAVSSKEVICNIKCSKANEDTACDADVPSTCSIPLVLDVHTYRCTAADAF